MTGLQTISYQISYLQIALSHGFKRLKAKFSICSSVNLACVEEKKLMSVITIAKVTLIFVKYVCVFETKSNSILHKAKGAPQKVLRFDCALVVVLRLRHYDII